MQEQENNIKRKKVCCKCKKEKELDNFNKHPKNKDGLQYSCRDCDIKRNKNHYKNNPKYYKLKRKDYNNKNPKWYKKYKTPEVVKKDNQNQIKKGYKKNWSTKQRKTNIQFKIKQTIGTRIIHSLKGRIKKSLKTQELLGCNIEEFKKYLEFNFLVGMNWENHGKVWEIDHNIPCNSFDLTDLSQQLECFNYTNLIPRFKTTAIAKKYGSDQIGNRNKGDKLI